MQTMAWRVNITQTGHQDQRCQRTLSQRSSPPDTDMMLQQRAVLAASSVLWTLVLTQQNLVCQSDVSRDRISTSQALREVIGLLGWLEVTIIGSSQISNENANIMDLTDDLSAANLAVLVVDVDLSHIAHLNLATLPNHNVAVVGSADFVTGVFHGLRHFQFTTRWITILAKEDVHPFEATVQGFENVLVVVNKTIGGAELWTLLREGDNCKFKFLSSLPLTTVRLTPQVIFPNPGLGLGGRQLRIVVMERSFFLFKSKETEVYEGVVIDMLTEIAKKLNFSYVLLQSPDGTWGEVNAKQEWTGAIGMLTRNEADMAVGFFTISPERSKVADASSAFFYDNARIVFRKRKQTPEPRPVFLAAFATPMYLLLAGLFLGVVVMLTFMEWCAWCMQADPTASPTKRRRFLSRTLAGTEGMFAGLLNQSVALKIDSRAGSVLMCSWMIFCVVLTSIYSSKLTSSLAVTDQALPFASLSELVRQKTYKWGIAAGTAKESILKSSPVEEHRAFYNGVLEFEKSDPDVHSADLQVHKAKVLHEAYAFFTGARDLYDDWHKDIPEIAMVSVDYFLTRKVFYLQKGSPYQAQVSFEIERMFETGVITSFIDRWSPALNTTESSARTTTTTTEGAHAIALPEVHGVFILAACGTLMAALALAGERLLAWHGIRVKAKWLQQPQDVVIRHSRGYSTTLSAAATPTLTFRT